jgi:hypothetical protein
MSLRRFVFVALLSFAAGAHAQRLIEVPPGGHLEMVKPSHTDRAIRRYDEPHFVIVGPHLSADAPLFVFMPGTHGKPANVTTILSIAAQRGYRAIGLSYDDTPAVIETCMDDPDPDCAEDFRAERVFGGDASKTIDNTDAESVQNRLAKLLEDLQAQHPDAGWDRYLNGHDPRWERVIVSGISQGAGMAAYIGKQKRVDRVVLFSGPWDFYGKKKRRLSPWLAGKSATPPDRWYAAYHQREAAAPLIAQSLSLLKVPADHICTFDAAPASGKKDPLAYHGDGIRNPAYASDWKFLLGSAD